MYLKNFVKIKFSGNYYVHLNPPLFFSFAFILAILIVFTGFSSEIIFVKKHKHVTLPELLGRLTKLSSASNTIDYIRAVK